jgi:transketolase
MRQQIFSKIEHCIASRQRDRGSARVVSIPYMERFNREPEEYREETLPNSCRKRLAIEAGVPEIWYQCVGLDGKVIGLHCFGLSAPGAEVMKEFGIDAQHIVEAARAL